MAGKLSNDILNAVFETAKLRPRDRIYVDLRVTEFHTNQTEIKSLMIENTCINFIVVDYKFYPLYVI